MVKTPLASYSSHPLTGLGGRPCFSTLSEHVEVRTVLAAVGYEVKSVCICFSRETINAAYVLLALKSGGDEHHMCLLET